MARPKTPLICQNCGKEFITKQANPKQYPKICSECRKFGGRCETCNTKIPYKRKFCSIECKEKSLKAKKGHKLQGLKIRGENNPAKRPDVRKKIRKGVTQSYINNPDLKFHRGRTYPSRATWGRRFLDGRGNKLKSLLELNIAKLLQKAKINYKYEEKLFFGGHYRYPDFKIGNLIIELCGYMAKKKNIERYKRKLKSYLLDTKFDIIFIVPKEKVFEFVEIQKEFSKKGRHLDIFALKGREIELNLTNLRTVSYSHFLDWYNGPCQRLHSHTSYTIDLYLQGPIKSKWLVDFKEAKEIANKVLDMIDHKVVVNKKNITKIEDEKVYIQWNKRKMELFSNDIFRINFEPTCENITSHLAEIMLEKFKSKGVLLLGLSFREGINNGVTAYTDFQHYSLNELEKVIGFHCLHYFLTGKNFDEIVKSKVKIKQEILKRVKELSEVKFKSKENDCSTIIDEDVERV